MPDLLIFEAGTLLFTGIPACLHPSTPLSLPCCRALRAVLAPSLQHQHSQPCSCTRPRSRYQHPTATLPAERRLPWHGSQAPRQGMCRELPVCRHVASVAGWAANGSMRTHGALLSLLACPTVHACLLPPPYVAQAHPFTPPHACPVTSCQWCTRVPPISPAWLPFPGRMHPSPSIIQPVPLFHSFAI